MCCFLWNILGALDLAYLKGLFYWFHYTRQTKSNAKVFQIKHAISILVCTKQIPVRPSQIDQIRQDGIVSLCCNELPWDLLLLMRYCRIPFPHQYLWGVNNSDTVFHSSSHILFSAMWYINIQSAIWRITKVTWLCFNSQTMMDENNHNVRRTVSECVCVCAAHW
jgi:hypothetical protein